MKKLELHSPLYRRPVTTLLGYPMSPLALKDRPWWQEITSSDIEGAATYWIRTDGVYTFDLRDVPAIDENDPLARPKARLGQIWLSSQGVAYVCLTRDDVERVEALWREAFVPTLIEPRYLVWGPGSPWVGQP